MCGIAGVVSFSNQISPIEIKKMTDTIRHRGPDGEGHFINGNKTVALGHRRLAIIDLSEGGKQPMHYRNNRYTITFNGEIYNYLEIKQELKKKGYVFQSESDTEVLLALYDAKKEQCLDDLDGMFAFAIWDELEQKLFCARDRFGEKPFFFYKDNTQFAFASEMKALFIRQGISKQVNYDRLFYFLAYGTINLIAKNDTTYYNQIFSLEPAHYLIVHINGNITKHKYWDIKLSTSSFPAVSEIEAAEKFGELFNISLTRRLRSDVPVGSCLSGGLDSSSIVRSIHALRANKGVQKTFSARFNNFKKDEGYFIEKVLEGTNIEGHNTWVDSSNFAQNFEKVFYHQEEPFGSASISAQWAVMELVSKNNIIVLLDGQGSDEYLAGYDIRFYTTFLRQLKMIKDSVRFEEERKNYINHFGEQPNIGNNKTLTPFGQFVIEKLRNIKYRYLERNKPHLNSVFTNQIRDIIYPSKSFYDIDYHLKYATQKELPELLRYADRNSMAFSLEVRLPFLNHELVEFAFTLPPTLKLHKGWSKYVLRKSMENVLPKEIAWRKDKVGFEPPHTAWLQSKDAQEIIAESKNILIKERIIKPTVDSQYDWRYLNAAQLFKKG